MWQSWFGLKTLKKYGGITDIYKYKNQQKILARDYTLAHKLKLKSSPPENN